MINRRTVLAGAALSGTLGGAALLLPGGDPAAQAKGVPLHGPDTTASPSTGAQTDLSPDSVTKFTLPMAQPPVATPFSGNGLTTSYAMTLVETSAQVLPGMLTTVRTFDGSFPGPIVKAKYGERVTIAQTNLLQVPVSVHLHGASAPADSDGQPMDTILPGDTKTYTYPNIQTQASLWYHDHAHMQESENVFRGVSGTYLLTDDTEQALNLPCGEFDVPIILRDARFDTNGQFIYTLGDFANRNFILANGVAWPYFNVQARKYRLRLYNGANLRFFNLALSDGSSFTQIASDGGLLPAPLTVKSLALSPGERADVVIDFSQYPVGTNLVLTNAPGAAPGPVADIGQVMQFRVGPSWFPDNSQVPSTLRTLPDIGTATVNRTFTLRMDETTPNGLAYINEQVYDPDRVDTTVNYGDTEIWTITNVNHFAPHNFHVHLVQFRVLERDGQPAGPQEAGLKDTVTVMPGETVKVQMTFEGYRGKFLYHCHLFDHAAMGMMATMQVV
ncbi:multicopper oxidase family protein [Kitasatospora sp. LaBMicrA B282]|uniref:multicopper oxidase family protein n=1 Tax=Kitasatospora sp. LaBMicrA B282 TaxID=3420949 RepID=UPI003D0CA46C